MIYKRIKLSDIINDSSLKDESLDVFISDESKEIPLPEGKPGLLIIPGGAYRYCSDREGEPIAFRFLAEGFNTFVLRYSVSKPYPIPQKQVAYVFKYILENSKEFNLKENCLSILGFSAGGHLASSYSRYYEEFAEELKVKPLMLRPFSCILGYPVIDTYNDKSDTSLVITDNFVPELREKLCMYKVIDSTFPPTFIFTTKNDSCVDAIHSKEFFESLQKNDVLSELVIYENGDHGGALYNNYLCGWCNEDELELIRENQNWAIKVNKFIRNLLK